MKNSDLIKKPIFIASSIIILAYFMSYINFKEQPYTIYGTGFSFTLNKMNVSYEKEQNSNTKTSLSLSETNLPLVNKLSPLCMLTILFPIISGLLIYFLIKNNDGMVQKFRMYIFVISVLLFVVALYTISSERKASIGIGIWLTLLASVFIKFEEKIIQKIKTQKS